MPFKIMRTSWRFRTMICKENLTNLFSQMTWLRAVSTEKVESKRLSRELRILLFSHTSNSINLAPQEEPPGPLLKTKPIKLLDQVPIVWLPPTCNSSNRTISPNSATRHPSKASPEPVRTKKTTTSTCPMHRTARRVALTIEWETAAP